MNIIRKIEKSYKDYINKLEKTNKGLFGSGKNLDCCELNKKNK